jgi:Domain of unknown function (DUF4070)
MNAEKLTEGYKKILSTIYGPRQYYERVLEFLSHYRPKVRQRLKPADFVGFMNDPEPRDSRIRAPGLLEVPSSSVPPQCSRFSEAVTLAILGYSKGYRAAVKLPVNVRV